jgi:uncharacterized repeat protein (TIGR03803 family)
VQASNGNLYGTTAYGGLYGDGTIFEMSIGDTPTLTTLHSFDGTDGATPLAQLMQASNGNLYGTTETGGANNDGTVFEFTIGDTLALTTLHSFDGTDGALPTDGLVQARDGNFYGTAHSDGANSAGTVFEMNAGGTLTTLHSFCSTMNGQGACTDGAGPYGGLIYESSGQFYGTTFGGGANSLPGAPSLGPGEVFSFPGVSAPSSPLCNGLFYGPYIGDLAVSDGYVCEFANGGRVSGNITVAAGGSLILSDATVTGNVTVTGGSVALNNTTIGNNLEISGPSTFSIGPSTTINGNLLAQNIASSAATNQVCGATVRGNLLFQNNGTAVQIGSASCSGNTIRGSLLVINNSAATQVSQNILGGSLSVTGDTGPTQITDNKIMYILACAFNSSITGSGNTALLKLGQCSDF